LGYMVSMKKNFSRGSVLCSIYSLKDNIIIHAGEGLELDICIDGYLHVVVFLSQAHAEQDSIIPAVQGVTGCHCSFVVAYIASHIA